jgi:hypothetical protein
VAAECQFVLGFKLVYDLIPETVGDCKVDVHYNPENGDGLQETTKGLLVWRKADNFTAFTDGYRSWVNGPLGLQERLNTERFDWEPPDPQMLALQLSDMPVGYSVSKNQTKHSSNEAVIQSSDNPATTAAAIARTGRLYGYQAGYTRISQDAYILVFNNVVVFNTPGGAHLSFELDDRLYSNSAGWSVTSGPTVGEESKIFRGQHLVGEGDDTETIFQYLLLFRKGSIEVGVAYATDNPSALSIEEVIRYARIVEGRIK